METKFPGNLWGSDLAILTITVITMIIMGMVMDTKIISTKFLNDLHWLSGFTRYKTFLVECFDCNAVCNANLAIKAITFRNS